MTQTRDNWELRPCSFSITKTYDKVGVFTSFDLETEPMGGVKWPDGMEPDIIGTPKEIGKHLAGVRKEAIARDKRGEDSEWYAAVWVDGVWFLAWTQLMLYEISEVASGKRKSLDIEDSFWVRKESAE